MLVPDGCADEIIEAIGRRGFVEGLVLGFVVLFQPAGALFVTLGNYAIGGRIPS